MFSPHYLHYCRQTQYLFKVCDFKFHEATVASKYLKVESRNLSIFFYFRRCKVAKTYPACGNQIWKPPGLFLQDSPFTFDKLFWVLEEVIWVSLLFSVSGYSWNVLKLVKDLLQPKEIVELNTFEAPFLWPVRALSNLKALIGCVVPFGLDIICENTVTINP